MSATVAINPSQSAMLDLPGASPLSYLVPFSALKSMVRFVASEAQLKAEITFDEFADILRKILSSVPVDETWYRAAYPDVANAIDEGLYASAKHHFVAHGYFEGRQPYAIAVDEDWYLNTYEDVRDGIGSGIFESAQQHFAQHGYCEGRKPAGTY